MTRIVQRTPRNILLGFTIVNILSYFSSHASSLCLSLPLEYLTPYFPLHLNIQYIFPKYRDVLQRDPVRISYQQLTDFLSDQLIPYQLTDFLSKSENLTLIPYNYLIHSHNQTLSVNPKMSF